MVVAGSRRKRDQSEREKLTHMQEREQRRKAKQLAKLKQREATEINSKIAEEQKKLLRTQRKLQSIRLIEELFRRIQLKQKHNSLYRRDELQMNSSSKRKELKMLEKALLNEGKEKNVRDRLVSKYKSAQEQELEDQRLKLRKAIEGNIVLRSVLDTGKKKARTPSISSLSSGSDISINEGMNNKKIKSERLLTPERNMLIPKEEDGMVRGYPPNYGYGPYAPYMNQNYNNYHQPPPGPFYPRGGGYYPQQGAPEGYGVRGRGYVGRRPRAPRGGYRGGMPRMPYFDGPNAHHAYYKYFKKLTEESGDRNNRDHSYSRSRSRSRRRSYTRSRSRTRSRSYSRSRSRSRRHSRSRSRTSRSRSRNRRTRTRSRSRHSRHSRSRSRSRSHKSKSRSRSRHRSHDRRSRSKHSRDSRSRNKSPAKTGNNREKGRTESKGDTKSSKQSSKSPKNNVEEERAAPRRHRSKSWSMPRDATAKDKSWSKSPSKKDV